MENQTSERNIMGQQIKLITPLVNSSLVPRHARTRPNETRQMVPTRNTIKVARKEPLTSNENKRLHPAQTRKEEASRITTLDTNWALKYSKAVTDEPAPP